MNFEKFGEMYLQSCRRQKNPDWKPVRNEIDVLSFGSHPWLTARRVEGFFVDVIDYETENTYWIEPERYYSDPEGSIKPLTPWRQTKLESRKRSGKWEETFSFGDQANSPKKLPGEA
nr:putative integron gene cassette protein [uncultured bacterium]